MGAHISDLYRELSSPSRGRDALLKVVSKGKIGRLIEHLDQHPADWGLIEACAGAVLEALIERRDLNPSSPEVSALIRRISPERLYNKLREIADRGQLDWALGMVTLVMERQTDDRWWWLLAQIQASLGRSDLERSTLLQVLRHASEPSLKLRVARRLLQINACKDAFTLLGELYTLSAWRDDVVQLLAKVLLSDGRWLDRELCSSWDQFWNGTFDATVRVKLWADMLQIAGEQVAYDRDALADGIGAMQGCLQLTDGRDLQSDMEQAQLGHELALKLMRFVRSLEPFEMCEQPVYMMLLDMLVGWEARWTERGITLEYTMEKELGSVWVDEQVFALALEVLWEQFASQLVAPTKATLRVQGNLSEQTVNIVLEPSEPARCSLRQPLAPIDTAFVDRVMKGHGCQWRYDGEQNSSLSVSISTTVPVVSYEVTRDVPEKDWLMCWQMHGINGILQLEQQNWMIREPFHWGVSLSQGLKRTLVADWAEQIRVIVHDLKNLFTFAKQWISQALSDPYSWTMAMERVAEIKSRMQVTLQEIRELAAQGGPPACQSVSVVELVRRVLGNSRAFLEAHSVTCSIDQKTGRSEVWADPERLISAITNLLKNGVEAMPEGGRLTFIIDQADEGFLELVIADTGVGIEADELPGLFSISRSTKPGGSGVGLAAVARMLASMGAEIKVESTPGLGSRFAIRLARPSTGSDGHSRPFPVPSEKQTRITQQALRAAAALNAAGDLKMTVHLWCKALIGQVEPLLRRSFPPIRARHLLAPVTSATKRDTQSLGEQHRVRLQDTLGIPNKQLVKKSETVLRTLITGDWDRLTHPLHWAILLQLFTGSDVYPWASDLCKQMAQWLVRADRTDELDAPDPESVADLGAELCRLLELALPGHLGA